MRDSSLLADLRDNDYARAVGACILILVVITGACLGIGISFGRSNAPVGVRSTRILGEDLVR